MIPKKRKLWNQIEILIESRQLEFSNENMMFDFFQRCYDELMKTNCIPEIAIERILNLQNESKIDLSKIEVSNEVITEEYNETQVIDSMPEPMAATVTRKGKKK